MMILLRVLLLGALVWLAWMIWRRIRGPAPGSEPREFENMVKCARCEQHVPQRLSVEVDGKRYCQEHRPGLED